MLLRLLFALILLPARLAEARVIGATEDRVFSSAALTSNSVAMSLKLSSRYLISQEDLELVSGAVGGIFCDSDLGGIKISSGVLIDSSGRVTTTLHSFTETTLASCYFKNFKGQKSYFSFSKANRKQIANYRLEDEIGSDQIRVRLKDPLQSVAIASDDSPVREGEEFYGITAYEEGINKKGVLVEPILRKATASGIQTNKKSEQTGFQSDADFSHGGSGGVNLFHRNGVLVAKGIFQGLYTPSNEVIQDNEPFDPKRNFILSTTLRVVP